MDKISRREIMGSFVKGGTALALVTLPDNMSIAQPAEIGFWQSASAPPAFRGQHKIKPLPFDPTKLKGLSEKLITSHHENNYGGAVKALNIIEQRLAELPKDAPPYIYGDLKREEMLRTNSMVLHELYFANLGGDGKASGKIVDLLKQWFGSYERWEEEFKKTAAALGGGSGWVMLNYNLHNGEVHNYWSWDHTNNLAFGYPLLVIDMYEHSYHMDYGARAQAYIDAFMQNINWDEVNRRSEAAAKR